MVYKWFAVLKEQYNAAVVSYAIMPNHLHAIIHFHKEGINLNTVTANGKRLMAYQIIDRLEKTRNTEMLARLKNLVTDREKGKGNCTKFLKIHLMQRPARMTRSDGAIYSHRFLLQKINYIPARQVIQAGTTIR